MPCSILQASEMTTVKFANSVDPDEVAQTEPPHLGLHLFALLRENFADLNFVICSFGALRVILVTK